ncbi:RES family NAD+ phosphorylase [Mycobacterium sp. DBP42]|uniref:RES family NAD+ phosphorylase n=1 Tax=Mycobacteriaceae TaxID=1762 RepID=UPI00110CFEA5|nr:RES family NAD+ phosphorylase [Mycobacterium sp. DBP42]TMS45427.1 RES domain-containing protein [Mycobacterium sp. DBP42]
MSETTVGPLWRVGYHAAPLAFTPLDMYAFNHRFDDTPELSRFRTMYFAEIQETCLREVLADFRPNLEAKQRHIERYGPEAADDIPAQPVTATWRRQNVLAPATLQLDGDLVDLFDPGVRQGLEKRHQQLLIAHDMDHLDLHQITAKRRIVTQTIAGDLFERGAAGIRFPSRLDGRVCIALFEHRGAPVAAGAIVALTDPAPAALITVTDQWELRREPAQPA